MLEYLDQHNQDPKPFVSTAYADLILGKVERFPKRISTAGHQRFLDRFFSTSFGAEARRRMQGVTRGLPALDGGVLDTVIR
jgi:hypothetical protein